MGGAPSSCSMPGAVSGGAMHGMNMAAAASAAAFGGLDHQSRYSMPFSLTQRRKRRILFTQAQIYELERCIECGCCIAACGTAQMREDFTGAVGLNQVTRFQLDPRDKRTDAEFYELVGDDSGVFGCMTLLGCEDMCPKNLPLAAQISFLRRRMVAVK